MQASNLRSYVITAVSRKVVGKSVRANAEWLYG